MRSTNTPAAPAARADVFQPVRLLQPDPRALAQLRAQVDDSTQKIEVSFKLSSKPHQHWLSMYVRLWRLFFPDTLPPIVGVQTLTVTSEPAKLQSTLEIARVVVNWSNDLSAPLVRGDAAQAEADTKRMRAIDEFQMRPRALPELPGDAGGDESAAIARMDARMFLARQEHDAEEKELRKKLALEEIDTAIATLATA